MTKKRKKTRKFRNFIIEWNNKYPWDYRWRRKYGVAFGSTEHLNTSWVDMKIDLIEQELYDEAYEKRKEGGVELEYEEEMLLNPNSPFKKKSPQNNMTNEEIDQMWDDINLEDFND